MIPETLVVARAESRSPPGDVSKALLDLNLKALDAGQQAALLPA